MVPELDLTAGALAIKWASDFAGVPDDVFLSVLSGLVCSGTWKGSCVGLIAWWLYWRSSRLDSTCQKASVRASLCLKAGLSVLTSLSWYLLAFWRSLWPLSDTPSGTSENQNLTDWCFYFFLTSTTGQSLTACRLWANFSSSTESATVFVIFQCFFKEVFDNSYC